MSYASSTIRSIQNVNGSLNVLNNTNATRTVTLGTTLTNTAKAVIIQGVFGGNKNGMLSTNKISLNNGWYISSTTQVSIVQTNNQNNGDETVYYNMYVVEYY